MPMRKKLGSLLEISAIYRYLICQFKSVIFLNSYFCSVEGNPYISKIVEPPTYVTQS